MKKQYVQAVLEMIQSGTDIQTVLKGLSHTLHSRGHVQLHAAVLRNVLRVLQTQKQDHTIVTVAKEGDMQTYATAIRDALKRIDGDAKYETKIDTTLIGGFVAQHKNTVLDSSYKTKLVSLYRTLTN